MAEAQGTESEELFLRAIAVSEKPEANGSGHVPEFADDDSCAPPAAGALPVLEPESETPDQAGQVAATDQEIVTREGFVRYVQDYHRRLIYYYLRKHLRLEDAQDLAQEAVLTLWKKRHQSKPPHQSFLFGIARRLYYAFLRTGPNLSSLDDVAELADRNQVAIIDMMTETDSEARAEVGLPSELLARTSALSQNQRKVIQLIYVEGLSMQEAAGKMGIAKGSVQLHLRRAVAGLRTLNDEPKNK